MSTINARAESAHQEPDGDAAGRPPALEVAHANVTDVRRELTFENGRWRHVLVIFTDLSLDPGESAHDTTAIDAMVQQVVDAARRAQTGFDVLAVRNA